MTLFWAATSTPLLGVALRGKIIGVLQFPPPVSKAGEERAYRFKPERKFVVQRNGIFDCGIRQPRGIIIRTYRVEKFL